MLHCNEGWNRMAGGIVSIAQQKGGAGKTTLAVQLGVAWLCAGRRVAMLDIDPQASLFAWFNVRRRAAARRRTGCSCRVCPAGALAASCAGCDASST